MVSVIVYYSFLVTRPIDTVSLWLMLMEMTPLTFLATSAASCPLEFICILLHGFHNSSQGRFLWLIFLWLCFNHAQICITSKMVQQWGHIKSYFALAVSVLPCYGDEISGEALSWWRRSSKDYTTTFIEQYFCTFDLACHAFTWMCQAAT